MKLTAKDIIISALFTALMIAGTFIRIPFPFLPVTLQTFFCALAGMILGPRLGALSMTVYMLLGLLGVPVFAGGGGLTYIFNKSFGFILGFAAGAYVIGKVSKKLGKPSFANNVKALIAGLFVIYLIGMLYMLLIMRVYLGNLEVGLLLVIYGNLPYLAKDIVLFLIAAAVSGAVIPRLQRTND
ncbi:MAG TPA: biotin transporter BioY [Clostridia bacterium]|nr:biotin transporter BioY [Clostridia bacterium]